MRRTGKWLRRGVILAVVLTLGLGATAWIKREELARLNAVNTLFAEDRIVSNFSNMSDLFFSVEVPRGSGPISPLPQGAPLPQPAGFDDWIAQRAVTSLLVMSKGEVRHESYHLGTAPEDRRISWSVAKSFLSALVGIALENRWIESLDDPVTRYAPDLVGSAYDGVSLRQVLQMSSGVAFNEDYFDFWSDINKMGRVLALGGRMDRFAAGQSARFQPAGTGFKYVSIDTHVIGMVLRGATGRSIADLLSEHIIAPLGLEAAPYYVTDGSGVAFVLGGLNLRTRDYARFGQMILQNGRWGRQPIVPKDWITESTRPSARTQTGRIQYGYQWWIPADAGPGEFLARGVYGQYIYFDQTAGAVIVTTGADRAFNAPGAFDEMISMFRTLVRQAN